MPVIEFKFIVMGQASTDHWLNYILGDVINGISN